MLYCIRNNTTLFTFKITFIQEVIVSFSNTLRNQKLRNFVLQLSTFDKREKLRFNQSYKL